MYRIYLNIYPCQENYPQSRGLVPKWLVWTHLETGSSRSDDDEYTSDTDTSIITVIDTEELIVNLVEHLDQSICIDIDQSTSNNIVNFSLGWLCLVGLALRLAQLCLTFFFSFQSNRLP